MSTKLCCYPCRPWFRIEILPALLLKRGEIIIICLKHASIPATRHWHNHFCASLYQRKKANDRSTCIKVVRRTIKMFYQKKNYLWGLSLFWFEKMIYYSNANIPANSNHLCRHQNNLPAQSSQLFQCNCSIHLCLQIFAPMC